MTDDFLTQHWSEEKVLAHHFFDRGKLYTAPLLSTQFDKPPIPPFTYLLITHFLGTLERKSSCSRQLMPFEHLCTQTSPQTHLISATHSLHFMDCHPNNSTMCDLWERDLSLSLTPEEWGKIYLNIHKGCM